MMTYLPPDLIIIGHIMIETINLSDGSIIGPVLGSPAAYSSVAASSLGINTGLVTVIGKDMPFYIVKPIINAGIDIRGICINGEDSRSTELIYDKKGNKKVSYKKVAHSITFTNIPKEYLNSGAFLICPMDFEVTTETISRLNSLNKLMMADLGGFGGAVSTMHPSTGNEKDKKNVKNIISKFDIIKASIEDCYYLFKDSMSYEEIIKTLHRWGAEIVLITLGDKGSVISNRNNLINIPAFEANMIDTTGAGDVYCATFLVEYLKTKDLYKSGLYASAAASILIEKTGGVNLSRMPTDKKIKKKIKSSSNN